MSYYDNYKKIVEVGGDDDLASCLQYNEQPFGVDDIKQVLAVWDGEHDGDHYRWILEMKDGRYMYLNGWCDYTGWDCQSEAYSLGPFFMWWTAAQCEETVDVRQDLLRQVENTRKTTRREEIGKDMPDLPLV